MEAVSFELWNRMRFRREDIGNIGPIIWSDSLNLPIILLFNLFNSHSIECDLENLSQCLCLLGFLVIVPLNRHLVVQLSPWHQYEPALASCIILIDHLMCAGKGRHGDVLLRAVSVDRAELDFFKEFQL